MIRRALLFLVAATLLALLAGASAAQAQAPTAGMSLGATAPAECNAQGCTVASSSPFSITVRADPAPNADLAGISTEVVFGGLVWQIRNCLNELQIGRADGEDVASCVQDPGPAGQARHVIISEVAAAPLAPLEDLATGDVISELAVRCPAAGTFNVHLTAVTNQPATDAPFGALFFRTDTSQLLVRTQGNQRLDLDGNGSPDEPNYGLADSLRVTCEGPGGVGSQSPVPIETTDGNGSGETPPAGGATATGGDATAGGSPTTTGTISPEDATATAEAASNGDAGDNDDDDGGSIWLWVIVGVAGVGAAAGLGYLAWRRYQGSAGSPPDASPPASTT